MPQQGINLLQDLNFNDPDYHFNHFFTLYNVLAGWQQNLLLTQDDIPLYFYPALHNGYLYTGDTVNPSGGTGPYSFLWTTPTAPILAQPVTAALINLCAGAYSVTITDALGCSAIFNFPLSNANAPIPVLTTNPPSCNGVCDGSITSITTGGTGAYSYFWNPNGEITQEC